jgi:hypothetical protein
MTPRQLASAFFHLQPRQQAEFFVHVGRWAGGEEASGGRWKRVGKMLTGASGREAAGVLEELYDGLHDANWAPEVDWTSHDDTSPTRAEEREERGHD